MKLNADLLVSTFRNTLWVRRHIFHIRYLWCVHSANAVHLRHEHISLTQEPLAERYSHFYSSLTPRKKKKKKERIAGNSTKRSCNFARVYVSSLSLSLAFRFFRPLSRRLHECAQYRTKMHLRDAGTRNCAHNLRARHGMNIWPTVNAAQTENTPYVRPKGGSRNAALRVKPAL